MAKMRDRIVVVFHDGGATCPSYWEWDYFVKGVTCNSPGYHNKARALYSARAFAARFVNPPEVTVEGEDDGKEA